jgi:hypothetical protein
MASGAVGEVQGAPNCKPAALKDVGVDHGRRHLAMAQELLDGANVVAGLQRVSSKESATTRGEAPGAVDDGVEPTVHSCHGRSNKTRGHDPESADSEPHSGHVPESPSDVIVRRDRDRRAPEQPFWLSIGPFDAC